MFYDPRVDLKPAPLKHNPFNALVAPRPIGWIGTQAGDGTVNLAPYSYFNAFASDPPVVAFAPNSKDSAGLSKDTLANLREVPEFTCSIVSLGLAEQMNQSSADYAAELSEFSQANLTTGSSRLIRPPYVAEAKAVLECAVYAIHSLPSRDGGRQSHLVIGEVIGIHIDDALIVEGKIDTLALAQVARLGYHDYSSVDKTFELLRPELD